MHRCSGNRPLYVRLSELFYSVPRRKRRPPARSFESLEDRRLLAIGDLDATFSGDGKATAFFDLGGALEDKAAAVAVDQNGKIVVAGSVQVAAGDFDFAVVRYNANGSLDDSFGANGRMVIPFNFGGTEDRAAAVAVDSQNRIVVAGYIQRSSPGDYDFGVARLNQNGSLDNTFSGDGLQAVSFDAGGANDDRAAALAIDSSDRIVLAGSAQVSANNYDFALARLTTGGSLDNSFGTGGKVLTSFQAVDEATAVTIDYNGRIVVAGSTHPLAGDSDFAVARYTALGALDNTFSSDGKQFVVFDLGGNNDDVARSIAIDNSSRIVVAGYATLGAGDTDFAIARLSDSGDLDDAFGNFGRTNVAFDLGPVGSRLDEAVKVLIDHRGRPVLVGSAQVDAGGNYDFAVARLLDSGAIDHEFSGNGETTVAFDLGGAKADRAAGAAFDAQGQLVMVGSTERTMPGDFDYASARLLMNTAPVAVDDIYVLGGVGGPSTTDVPGVWANDSDPDGDPLLGLTIGSTAHGTVSAAQNGAVTYTPNASFKGIDRAIYSFSDGRTASNFGVLTLLSHNAAIVRKFYLQVLQREPEDAGLEYWTGRIDQGAPYSAVFAGFYNSDERLDPIVSQYYQDFLLRPADPAGLSYWKQQYVNQGGPELVIAGMISSPEFFVSAGGTNSKFVEQLYLRLLNRVADPQGLAYWTNKLDSQQLSRSGVVLSFQYSDENRLLLIDEWHQLYLNRAATSGEQSLYLNQMKLGVSQRQVQMNIIDTPEYGNNPALPAPGAAARIA